MSVKLGKNGKWWARVVWRTPGVKKNTAGARKEVRRQFDTKEEALRFESEAVRKGPESEIKTACTLIEAAELARVLHWSGNKDENQSFRRAEFLCEYLGKHRLITDIHPEEIVGYKQYLKDKGNKGSTINRKLAPISKMWEAAAEKGYVSMSSKPFFKREKEPKGRVRWLFPNEEKMLSQWFIDHGRDELAQHLHFSCDTGLRTMESLVIGHQHVTDEGVWIEPVDAEDEFEEDWFAKNAKSRIIPLTARCRNIIKSRSNHSPIFEDLPYHVIYYWWEKARQELFNGDRGITPYVTRHTCASRLVQKKMHINDIMKWMGHAKLSTTQIYAKNSVHDIEYGAGLLEEFH